MKHEPTLHKGEHYAGIILNDDGTPSHHLILLPQDGEELEWDKAKDWAEEQGGELPTRREQSLLYANCKAQFENAWYWSSEQHAAISGYAWCQHFGNGFQGSNHKHYEELRARLVRSSVI